MIITIDAQKIFGKMPYPLMTELSRKGMPSEIISASITFSESFQSRISNQTRMATHTAFFQRSFGSPSTTIKQEEKIKSSKFQRKKQNCHYLQMTSTIYRKPKDSVKKLLELINKYAKVRGYKVNTHNLLHFIPLIMNYQKETEERELFTVVSKE